MAKPPKEDGESPRWHIGAPMMADHAEQLGRVVALWSRLEHMMNGAICQMTGIGLNLGDIFFHNINMPARHLILESVATRYLKEKDPRLCEALIKCSSEIREYRKRNQLVHGLWSGRGIIPITRHPSRKTHEREIISWPLKDMVEVGNDISTFIVKLWGCIERLDDFFPHPPEMHRPWRRKPSLRSQQRERDRRNRR